MLQPAVSGLRMVGNAHVGPQGVKVLEGLLEGVEVDILQIVDMTAKDQQQLCVPMLATTLLHQAKVALPTTLHRCLMQSDVASM